ncbi:type 1 glutamine amidotransferase [Nocardioides sp. SR21]|uniref:type 1 glutamine amidotransferase n=1 Tax=Nocardioides sp. SR21 TaxID=2919501 RepID=UPI001FA9C795|nr:aminotransferase [Nocardioides sp. SR21]
MRVLVIQHDHSSPIGPVGERFNDHGYDVVTHAVVAEEHFESPGVTTDFPDFTSFDAVVPMGAPWSTYDTATIGSWVVPELEGLRAADAAGVPVLGICFGGQLLAEAHGGSVRLTDRPEVGWYDVASSDPDLVPAGPWFEWHYDAWTLPPGATEIARNANASQAFALRRNLAVQFHPELTSAMLTGWLAYGGDAKARDFGLDPVTLLARTRAVDDRSRSRAHALVDGFLARVVSAAQYA